MSLPLMLLVLGMAAGYLKVECLESYLTLPLKELELWNSIRM